MGPTQLALVGPLKLDRLNRAPGLMLFFGWIEQMTRRGIVGFTCETHDWDY